ncbi:DNA primase-helicase subunit [Escherichia phage vB_EcoM_005]|uniref:DNA primase-helicase subunit n=1 Tax=Escherichia phage vB_EcoM_005 TaxID=2500761 RepID=A0A3T0ILX5_9CAUD|nr:DNA primase-helicase subunit [Escherichia phage vB_EcoM_005]AZV01074.1 DNA primase-helicase subunit [Escherichia phage vB_EcoM_005]
MVETILAQLLGNSDYFTKVWPYMNDSYFDQGPAKTLFKEIKKHVNEYNAVPSKNALSIALDNSTLSEVEHQGAKELLSSLNAGPEDQEWLVKETEKYVQKAAMYNATSKIIEIQTNADLPVEQQNRKLPGIGAIPGYHA